MVTNIMREKLAKFQPGALLHEAIIGAFRANGDNFDAWCKRNGITPSVARNATFGQSRGPAGKALLARLVEGADYDFVSRAYAKRLEEHAAAFKQDLHS